MSLRRDSAYNLLGNGIPLLAAAFTIPYLFASLGAEGFGVLTLIWALIGYFGLFDLGVGRALTYEVSRRFKDDSEESIRRTIKAGLILTVFTGILGGIFVYFVIAPQAANWFHISEDLRTQSKLAFEITALGIIPTTLTSGLRGALEGFKRFFASNVNRLVLGSLMFIVPAAVIWFQGTELGDIALYLVAARYLVCFMALFQLRQNIFNSAGFRPKDMKPLVNFGIWVTISGLIGPVMVYGDRFFVSAAVGAQELPLYAVPQEGLQRMLIIPTALAVALMPRMAMLKDKSTLAALYTTNIKRITFVMFFVCVLVAIIAKPVLSIWISNDFAQNSIVIVYVLCAGMWLNSIAQMPITLLHAVGKPRLVVVAQTIELGLYVALIIVLAHLFGIVGAAIAWSLRVTIDLALLQYFAKKSIT